MVKRPTIPKSRWCTTLLCIVNYDTCFRFFLFFSNINISRGSASTWFRYGGTFDHYFITNLLLSLFWKIFKIVEHLAKLWGKLISSNALCAGALSCWKIWRRPIAGNDYYYSITLQLINCLRWNLKNFVQIICTEPVVQCFHRQNGFHSFNNISDSIFYIFVLYDTDFYL